MKSSSWADLALHAAHDAAMVGMSIEMDAPMEPAAMLNDPFCGTLPAQAIALPPPMHHGGGLITGFTALVAIASAIQAFRSDNKPEALHLLLMSTAMAVMAIQMETGNLATATIGFMVAHGILEAALGTRQLLQGFQPDCDKTKAIGLCRIFHGVCLAAAQGLPYLALLLYLAMAGATAAQVAIQASPTRRR